MARAINRLSAVRIKAIKTPGRFADGGGLYLLVKPDGRKTWLFRYRDRQTQKLRDKGLGALADVTLERARAKAAEARRTLQDGVDPIDAPRAADAARARAKAQERTFGHCAGRYIASKQAEWRSEKHRYQWGLMEAQCVEIWDRPVGAIDAAAVLSVLEPIWQTKTETASRLRQRIERVLDWATTHGLRSGENPARWRGHLQNVLASPKKLQTVTHMAAMPYARVQPFMAKLDALSSLSAKALQLQILTATRPGESIAARWEEFDLPAARWTIPGERMKAGKPHTIPLSPRVVALLETLPCDRSGFLFPGTGRAKAPKPMTTAAPLKTLRALEPDLSCHGFRSTFRDWTADQTAYSREEAEAALAHTIKDKTEAAYRRGNMMEKRTRMMADWEAHCYTSKPNGENVTPIKRSSRK